MRCSENSGWGFTALEKVMIIWLPLLLLSHAADILISGVSLEKGSTVSCHDNIIISYYAQTID